MADEPIPLSSAQERVWFHLQMEPASIYYNSSFQFALRGTLDINRLERAFAALALRQSVLRTTYESRDALPVQVIRAEWTGKVTIEDLSDMPSDQRALLVAQRASLSAALSFDLVNGPVARLHVIRRDTDDYLLIVTVHHIAIDGWSFDIFFDELAELYAAELEGREARLKSLPVEYADFAIWQRNWLTTPVAKSQLDYWREHLDGVHELLRLPVDRPHQGTSTGPALDHSWLLPLPAVAALRELSSREGVSSFMIFMTAVVALLSRYSTQDDIVVATPIAARTRREIEPLIGFFVNTLPLRVRLNHRMTLRELLREVKQTAIQGFANQDIPFDVIVKEVGSARSAADTPLANVLLVGLSAASEPFAGFVGAPGRFENGDVGIHEAHFPLTIGFEESGSAVGISIMFRGDLFEQSTIDRLSGHFDRILEVLLSDPDRELNRIELIAASERERLMHDNYKSPSIHGASSLVHELFTAQALRTPDAIAVGHRGVTLTYSELSQRAEVLAAVLHDVGVCRGEPIAVYLPRGNDVARAVLGIMMAGSACLPLDPSYPAARLRQMLDAAGVRRVIGRKGFGHLELLVGRELIEVDRVSSSSTRRASDLTGSDLCLTLFTSGSTGAPKGIAIPHKALANFIQWQVGHLGLSEPATTLQVASLGFDTAYEEMFTAWATGSQLEFTDEEVRQDPAALADVLCAAGVRRWLTSYVSFQQVAEVFRRRGDRPSALELVICSGEALRLTPAIRWLCGNGVRLVNQYGPTETLVVTFQEVDPVRASDVPPIGGVLEGCTSYVLDHWLGLVPLGAEGDLYIGGVQLARGYLGRPSATAERFIPDLFGAPGARLYRTGDRVRRDANGVLHFVGRDDDQVKIRGNRVELAEVEAALVAVDGVSAACVAVERSDGGDRLIAAVVPSAGATLEGPVLRNRLASRLPSFAVPARVAVLALMPMTANGKADRRAVASLGAGEEISAREHVAPRTESERRVAKVFADVCGLRAVGVQESFFEIGGDSLRAVRAASLLGLEFGRSLPVKLLFSEPTVERLAVALGEPSPEEMRSESAPPARQAIPRRKDSTSYPVSPATEAFVRMQQDVYPWVDHLVLSTWIDGSLSPGALIRSLSLLIARHAPLRLRLSMRGREVVQALGMPPSIPVMDLDEAAAFAFAHDEATRTFDLEHEGPTRLTLLRIGPERHLLSFVVHHAVIDGGSIEIIERELWGAYDNIVDELPYEPPRLISDVFDSAAWLRAFVGSEAALTGWEFWRRRMADARPTDLPIDRPRREPAFMGGPSIVLPIPLEIDAREQRGRGSLYPIFLAAFAAALRDECDQDRLTVMSSFSNRDRPGAGDLVGNFTNPILMPIDLRRRPDLMALPAAMLEVFSEGLTYPELPLFRPNSPWLGPADLAPYFSPDMFRVNLNYVRFRPAPASKLRLTPVEFRTESTMRTELMLFCANDDSQLKLSLHAKASLFDSSTVERIAGRISDALLRLLH